MFKFPSLTHLINAVDFSVLADETTNMTDQAELSIFVRQSNSDKKAIEEFNELTEVGGSKGGEHLFGIIKVFDEKGLRR